MTFKKYCTYNITFLNTSKFYMNILIIMLKIIPSLNVTITLMLRNCCVSKYVNC